MTAHTFVIIPSVSVNVQCIKQKKSYIVIFRDNSPSVRADRYQCDLFILYAVSYTYVQKSSLEFASSRLDHSKHSLSLKTISFSRQYDLRRLLHCFTYILYPQKEKMIIVFYRFITVLSSIYCVRVSKLTAMVSLIPRCVHDVMYPTSYVNVLYQCFWWRCLDLILHIWTFSRFTYLKTSIFQGQLIKQVLNILSNLTY